MQAVGGILGGYISRGVYTVSGPFHPFGGGVDIIVVEQQDGSFKSSPWYIRFGKFSGVLKSRENVVNIVVNGNEAGFHMYLDSKGEAYFLQECESSEEGEFILPPLTSGDETNGSYKNGLIEKTQPSECESNQKESVLVDVENRKIDSGTDAHHNKNFGSIFKGKSVKDGDSLQKISRQDSLEQAERAADLLETRWSTNLPTESSARRYSLRIGSCDKDVNDVSPIVEDQGKINCDNALGSSGVGLSDKVASEIATVEALGGDTGDILPCLIAHQEIIEVCRSETEGGIADGFDVSHDIENGLVHAAGAVIEDLVENYSIANIESSNINKCALNEMGELVTSHDSVDQVEDGNVYRETFECSSITHNDANDKSVQPFLERNDQINLNEDIYETSDVKNEISVNEKGNSSIGHHVHIERCTFTNFGQNISLGVSDVQSPMANIGNMELSLPHTEQLFLDSALTDMDLQNQESNLDTVKRDGETEGFICQGVEYAKQDCSSENISQRDAEELNSHSQTDSARVHSLCSLDAKPHCLSSFSNANDLECQAAEITGLEVNGCKSSSATTAADRHVGYIFKKDANVSSATSEMEDDHLLLYDDSTYCASDELPSETITSNKVQDEANPLVTPETEVGEDNSEDITNRTSVEALSGIPVIRSLPICVPGSEANLEVDVELSRSLPNLWSHLCHLEASDNFNKQSLSLPSCSRTYEEGKHKELFRPSEFNLCSDNTIIQAAREQISAESLLLMSSKEQIDMKFNPAVELSQCKHLLFEGMGSQAAARAFEAEKIDLEKFAFLGPSIVKNNKLVVKIGSQYFPWDAAAPIILGMVSFGQDKIFDTKGMIAVDVDEKVSNQSRSRPVVSNAGSWWPFTFRRQRSTSAGQLVSNENKQNDTKGETMGSLSGFSSTLKKRVLKKYVQTLTPSSQQLAFLNLKEGRNSVTLTYETALGRQQVDARIYLWKWNTRIVVSDVDGTITKSDVLGHVMPLVGKDWSQTGVVHLFSSIKDNGYQFLYLSARAVSQASLTRHFLVNLSQDGKTLPDGPVVISPDGLFPSLYREVIRRAPQEFKISCLEDIRALFPPDSNPFYAGFGNRPTDEISYLKVGIPKGKIFTVNPKGEVAAGQCFYTKSYSSLHALVHEIFPAASSVEQDFNSWNFWRMPLLDVDDI